MLVSTVGRKIARWQLPRSLTDTLRSPLPWVLLAIVTLLSLAHQAMPPVSFAGVTVSTPSGAISGGYLNRSSSGVYLVTCTALADASSIDERVRLVNGADVTAVAVGGPAVSLDSGRRASLISLALRALGVDGAVRPLFNADLRPQRGTCGGADPRRLNAAREDPALGSGVIVEPPGTAMPQSHDGEAPIQQDKKLGPISALARRYQPTLLTTAADRFWPVSVNALLADRGPHGGPTCLMQHRAPPVCGAQLTVQNLAGPGSMASDYLQFPVRLVNDPRGSASSRHSRTVSTSTQGRCTAGWPIPGGFTPGTRPSCTSSWALR
ncbi:MAG: hypothetical protein M3010_08710 [Candidatus Dormibacteraeota bacterium]|nr:hypothetical protein [Candidatus Dormibacteraeota bacterium]